MSVTLPAKAPAAQPERIPLGFLENGLQTFDYYRPSQKRLADAIVRAKVSERPYVDLAPATGNIRTDN